MPGGTTVPYKKTKHKTFNAFCTELAFLVNTQFRTGASKVKCQSGQHRRVRHGAANQLCSDELRERASAHSGDPGPRHAAEGRNRSICRPRGGQCTRAHPCQRREETTGRRHCHTAHLPTTLTGPRVGESDQETTGHIVSNQSSSYLERL